MRKRQAARVLLFNPQGEILLVRFAIPQTGVQTGVQTGGSIFVFWAAPGGEIEPGESPPDAARREIREELGLDLEMQGPIRTDANIFPVRGEMVDNTDFYFRALCDRDAPSLIGITPDEIEIMKEIRWWSSAELALTAEKVFPVDLAAWVRELQQPLGCTISNGANV